MMCMCLSFLHAHFTSSWILNLYTHTHEMLLRCRNAAPLLLLSASVHSSSIHKWEHTIDAASTFDKQLPALLSYVRRMCFLFS